MYGSCGEFGYARKVFDEMPDRNLVSWSLILFGANKSNEYEVGTGLFVDLMRTRYFAVNQFALGSVMKVCVGMGAVKFGLCVHCFAAKIDWKEMLWLEVMYNVDMDFKLSRLQIHGLIVHNGFESTNVSGLKWGLLVAKNGESGGWEEEVWWYDGVGRG
ncbi:pentatricopeptide repeat-containing protein [Tanacetum coccineum]